MAQNSKIEWTATYNPDGTVTPGRTWNPTRGCTKVSEGCKNCYAMGIAYRFSGKGQPYEGLARKVGDKPQWTGKVTMVESMLLEPLKWRKPCRVFVDSMSDLFHEGVPNEFIAACFGVMAATPHITYQILTKRSERLPDWFAWVKKRGDDGKTIYPSDDLEWRIRQLIRVEALKVGVNMCNHQNHGGPWPLPNVWIGVSVEDQKTADERIPHLLQIPAAVRFLSCEPMLGPVDIALAMYPPSGSVGMSTFGFTDGIGYEACIHWVICGGESGPDARPMNPQWARSLRDQCVAANVPYFFKQHGEWVRPEDIGLDRYSCLYTIDEKRPTDRRMGIVKVGKKLAGRVLDGRTWDEFPAGYRAEELEEQNTGHTSACNKEAAASG